MLKAGFFLHRQCLLILFLTLLGFSTLVAGSQFTAISTGVKQISTDGVDMLVPGPSNSAGISYTKFSSFSADRVLKIINTRDTHGNPAGTPAKLIIIHSDYINLRNSIELVGETADLLLISSNTSNSISCYSCSFTNFGRVTLAHANPQLDVNYSPGLLSLSNQGGINVHTLSASGVASLELIAKNISVNGTINTQIKASYSNDGSYQINPNGGVIVGAGGVNIFSGYNIQYPTLTLKAPIVGASLAIYKTARITTQAVHIATAANFILSGDINTKSDVVTTASYRGQLSAIEESIKIYSLSDNADITLNGTLSSDNLIDIQSATNINLNGAIKARSLNIVAGNKVFQRGNSEFFTATVAASSLENNGKMMGRVLNIATLQALQNRFGGKLIADEIALSSKHGAVRNGSQYPFRPKDDTPLVLRPDSPDNISLGTINGMPFADATKVSDLSAHIIGKTVTIVAANNVENINPYFEYTLDTNKWANGVPFDQIAAARVQIIADNKLNIGSSTYVLNSSAIMGVNNPGGEFVISSPYITNERYNTQVVIQPFTSTSSSGTNTTVTVNGTEAALMVFSPPGIIYSFSPLGFYFTVKSGGFINNTAYFEVLNNATFTSSKTANEVETSRVTSIGLALEQQLANKTTITAKTITVEECQARAAKDEASQRACMWGPTIIYSNLAGTTEETMQGTLFSVKGTINGEASEFYGTNHRTIEKLREEQISNYIALNSGQTGLFTDSLQSGGVSLTATYSYVQKATLSADGTSLYVIREGTQVSTTGVDEDEAGSRFLAKENSSVIVDIVKVSDFLAGVFKDLKEALVAMLQAFNSWWTS